MKALTTAAIVAGVLLSVKALSPPTTVPAEDFDVNSYVGTWYQLADYPQFYEFFTCKDCVTAQYGLNSDGTVEVVNQALGPNNCTIKGVATTPDASEPAKLDVRFDFVPSFIPDSHKANYWILELGSVNADGLYSWSLVSDENRDSLYILSRTPTVEDDLFASLKEKLVDQEFDLSKLRVTDQSCYTN
eukprot:TRINITY_DN2821_c0_g1_i1.p1 TRINITY_DN2821_c0_g1~~TRINITY_DN2821_c0_g1_i1.p1  ORF type:complete len:188 (+),score=53.41 TRINITY_DN2821_c0_g1_i1:3-566(+)